MKRAILAILAVTACAAERATPAADIRLENGQWFDGEGFSAKTAYVVDGMLEFSEDEKPAGDIVDLRGGYVAPPYCEAHNHNLGDSADAEEIDNTIQGYLSDGVFYAMMPGSFAYYREIIADKLNNPKSVDVAFANNGLTGSGGHPRGLRESLMARFGNYPEFTEESLPDKGYFEADTLEQMNEKWALIRAERPDFIKAMLYFSEEYGIRKDNEEFYGRRGLNPDLLPELVRMAHDAELRVAVHVETEADMATALRAGADIIAHLPSNDSTVRLSDETVALATTSNAAVVTTLSVAKRFEQSAPELYAAILEAQKDNLKRLNEAGANLVVGSDRVFDTSRGEADHLAGLGVLDNATILQMWTDNCAKTVFPGRKIGRLANGYEASFLVLEGNPLEDFGNTRSILKRMKDGAWLEMTAEPD